jgi:hypothetical protein
MLQAKLTKDDARLYDPGRDVAHCFDFVIEEVAKRVEDGRWQVLARLAEHSGVSEDELGRACADLCRFVYIQGEFKKESMASCLARSGFLDRHEYARVILLAHLGSVILGMHWAGVRAATLGGDGPASLLRGVRWHGHACAKLMTLPPWRRRLYLAYRRLRKAWRALWRADAFEG